MARAFDNTERTTDYNSNERRLQELGGSDFEVADGQPDIRGWDVKDASGQRIGEVDDLIFDTQSRKVRYMKIDLEGNVLDLEARDVLVPIGLAQLDESDDDVILNNVTAAQLKALPEYDDDDISTDFERGVRRVFGTTGGALTGAAATTDFDNDTDFYSHEHFNEENLYRNRRKNFSTDRSNMDATSTSDTTGRASDLSNTTPLSGETRLGSDYDEDYRGIRLRNRQSSSNINTDATSLRDETSFGRRSDRDLYSGNTYSDTNDTNLDRTTNRLSGDASDLRDDVSNAGRNLRDDVSNTGQNLRDRMDNTFDDNRDERNRNTDSMF